MARCSLCGKKRVFGVWHTHKPGVAGGQWKKKAPKTQKIFKPNLQKYQGKIYCTRCLRKIKRENKKVVQKSTPEATVPVQ